MLLVYGLCLSFVNLVCSLKFLFGWINLPMVLDAFFLGLSVRCFFSRSVDVFVWSVARYLVFDYFYSGLWWCELVLCCVFFHWHFLFPKKCFVVCSFCIICISFEFSVNAFVVHALGWPKSQHPCIRPSSCYAWSGFPPTDDDDANCCLSETTAPPPPTRLTSTIYV